jgi:hypothetical protein
MAPIVAGSMPEAIILARMAALSPTSSIELRSLRTVALAP